MSSITTFRQIHEAIKNPESKIEDEIIDKVEGSELSYLNKFLKDGATINGEKYESIDSVVTKYKEKIKSSKDDANLGMLAPIIAAMITTIEIKNK